VIKILILSLFFTLTSTLPGFLYAQNNGGDRLNETPFYVVPSEMTFEEYEDANRRLSVGLMLLSVPFPGSLHFYANERREAWMHVGVAAAGLASIVIGIGASDEKNTWPDTEFQIIDITGQDGTVRRYEKIPFEEESGAVNYDLRFLPHDRDGGTFLIALGVGLLAGQLFYDWYDGIKTIERKRNKVRFKYGKNSDLGLNFSPHFDPANRSLGASLSLEF